MMLQSLSACGNICFHHRRDDDQAAKNGGSLTRDDTSDDASLVACVRHACEPSGAQCTGLLLRTELYRARALLSPSRRVRFRFSDRESLSRDACGFHDEDTSL